MSSLTSHLDSTYIAAANRLEGRGAALRIVAYVESYDDIFFWNQLLGEVEDEVNEAGGRRLHFEVLLPSRNSLCRGKKMALSNRLGPQMIACVDADYDYLEQGATPVSHEVCSSPYVLHPIVYAIENYQCYAPILQRVCVMATLNDREIFDFKAFLENYSQIIHRLFMWNVWAYTYGRHTLFPHRHQACILTFQFLFCLNKISSVCPKACLFLCNDRGSCGACKSCHEGSCLKIFSHIL